MTRGPRAGLRVLKTGLQAHRSWLVVAAAVGALAVALGRTSIVETFERKSLDARMRLLRDPDRFRADFVFVTVDQFSLNELKKYRLGWPWPRSVWKPLLEIGRDAKLVLSDIGFTEPTAFLGNPYPEEDQTLASGIRSHSRYVQITPGTDHPDDDTGSMPGHRLAIQGTPAALPVRSIVRPIREVEEAARRCALSRLQPDPDGTARRYPTLFRYRDEYYPSPALAALLEIAGRPALRAERGALVVGDLRIPVDEEGQMLLWYDVVDGELERVSAAQAITAGDLMKEGKPHALRPDRFRDRVVFLGALAPGLFDVEVTPVDAAASGTIVHAAALANLLDGRMLRRVPGGISALLLLALVAAVCGITRRAPARTGALASAGLTVLYLAGTAVAARSLWWMDVVAPTGGLGLAFAATSALNYLHEGRVRRRFRQYVAPAVVEKILARTEAPSLEGERKELTILFLDFAGFTELSERLDPGELVKLLNEYHNEAVEEIFRHEGTLDKFIGDAIMAFWNDPVAQPEHRALACRAAAGIVRRLGALSERMRERGLPEMRARIGMNTGATVVGNMGSKVQFNYTALGDAVNLASRLEGVNKEFGTQIVVGEATVAGAREVAEVRELALITVKGKTQPVRIYELLGLRGETDPARVEAARKFERALTAFREGRWAEAAKGFDGTDRASRIYRELCGRYAQDPPGAGWEGVSVMEHK